MTFRRRTFPEVLDNLLTTITKGVAAESHPFPPEATSPLQHNLQQPPVADIISVYGSRNGQPHIFRKDVDYQLVDRQVLEWKPGAELPDPDTLVSINYYPVAAQPVLTDIQTGSVIRTLAETTALELARLYAQLEVVYKSGFIDTASGKALDQVVALLGVDRVQGGRAVGEVEFRRSPATPGTIEIPAGTRILTADGNLEYETTAAVTMGVGQTTIRVPVRDLEQNPRLEADQLTVLPIPIAGIASVTNPAPTAIANQDETDAELRTRAKNFLHGSERATLGAIQQAIARQGLPSADVVEVAPGRVEITLHADVLPPEQEQRLLRAIEDARPAGVQVVIQGMQPPRKVNLAMQISTVAGLIESDLRIAQRTVREKLQDYFDRLPAKQPASLNRLVGLVLSVPQVQDVRFLSATLEDTQENVLDLTAGQLQIAGFATTLGTLRIANPALPTQLSVVVTHPATHPTPDKAAIQTALTQTLTYLNTLNASELPPTAPDSDRAKRLLSYGKLLHTIPLPNKAAADLETYDTTTAPPPLPNETTITPYQVHFIFTQDNSLSQTLTRSTDPPYPLTPLERLTLTTVEINKA